MRGYETLYIVRPDFDEEKLKEVIEKYSVLITDNGGEVTKVDSWGKRKLAYEVKKFREGYYVLMNFQSETEVPEELERIFGISDDVIRYLLIREGE